jgi:PAS domain S-box-containing protein
MALFSSRIADTDILNAIGDALPDRMVVFLDDKGKVIFRSNTLLDCKNCTICNVGDSIYDNLDCPTFEIFKMIPKEQLKNLKKPIERTVSRFDGHNKKKHLLHTILEPIEMKGGELITYLFSVTDRTELSRVEGDLIKQKELLNIIVRNLPHIVFVKDLEGRFLACNIHCEELLGASEEEAIGKSDFDFFETELAKSVRKYDELVLKLGEKMVNEEWLRYPDAHDKLFETTKTPLYSKNGSLLGILGVSREITKEKELQEQLMLTQYSVDNAIIPIFWVDAKTGAIFYANEAACKSLGYSKEELANLGIIDIDPNFDEVRWEDHAKKLSLSRIFHFETLHRRKDGSIFPVEILA